MNGRINKCAEHLRFKLRIMVLLFSLMPTYTVCPPADKEYCLNGGECFYLAEDPSVYICSCFMPFYGPQCEHEAPSGSKTDKQLPARSDEMEPEVKRSVDRAMTITALVFILITFLGLVTLAWYLSSRRRKDYKRWCKMKGSSDVGPFPHQTMDRAVQTSWSNLPKLSQVSGNSDHSGLFEQTQSPVVDDEIQHSVRSDSVIRNTVLTSEVNEAVSGRAEQGFTRSPDRKPKPEIEDHSLAPVPINTGSVNADANDGHQFPVANRMAQNAVTMDENDEIDLAFELAHQAKSASTVPSRAHSKRPSSQPNSSKMMTSMDDVTTTLSNAEKDRTMGYSMYEPDITQSEDNRNRQLRDSHRDSPPQISSHFHTLPHYTRQFQTQSSAIDTFSHNPYVNVRDIQRFIHPGRSWYSTLPKRSDCQPAAVMWRSPVTPLSVLPQPFVVASQHDALLQELFNRGSQDTLGLQ